MALSIAKCDGCGAAARVESNPDCGTFTFDMMYPPSIERGRKLCAPAWWCCWACGGTITFKRIKAKVAPAVVCDHRCTRSKGASCQCSCGGENHGKGL